MTFPPSAPATTISLAAFAASLLSVAWGADVAKLDLKGSAGTLSAGAKAPPKIPNLPLNPDGSVKGGMPAVTSALLANNRGVFVGDAHGNNAVPDTLSKLLPTLKSSGVKMLFIEMFKSKDQAVLDQFAKDGNKETLKKYLVANGWDKDSGDPKSPWVDHIADLLSEARKNGIKIYGIDTEHTGSSRIETANPHWTKVIESVLSKQSPSEKYVVYGGKGHSANYPANQGVNMRLGIPSVVPNEPIIDGFKIDPGQIKPNANTHSSDFVFAPG